MTPRVIEAAVPIPQTPLLERTRSRAFLHRPLSVLRWKGRGALPLLLVLALPGCGRVYRFTEEIRVDGGTIVIEHWDDPVDQLRSRRLHWLPDGEAAAEPVAETFAEGAPKLMHTGDPGVTHAICLGAAGRPEPGECCFLRFGESGWRRSRESVCDSSPLSFWDGLRRVSPATVERQSVRSGSADGEVAAPAAAVGSPPVAEPPTFRGALDWFELCWESEKGKECWIVTPDELARTEPCGELESPWLDVGTASGSSRCRFSSEPELIAWLPSDGLAVVSISSHPAQNYEHHVFAAETQNRRTRHLFDEFGSALIRPMFAPGGQLLAYGVAQRGAPCVNRQVVAVFDLASDRSIPLPLPDSDFGPGDVVIRSHSIVAWRSERALEVRSESWRCRGEAVEKLEVGVQLLTVPAIEVGGSEVPAAGD